MDLSPFLIAPVTQIVRCREMKRDVVLEAVVLTIALSILVSGCGRTGEEGPASVPSAGTQDDEAGTTSQDRLQACPACGAGLIQVPMLVGLPSKDMLDTVDRGEALLAGCVGNPDNPRQAFICLKCRKWKTRRMTHWQPLPKNFGEKAEAEMDEHPTRQ